MFVRYRSKFFLCMHDRQEGKADTLGAGQEVRKGQFRDKIGDIILVNGGGVGC